MEKREKRKYRLVLEGEFFSPFVYGTKGCMASDLNSIGYCSLSMQCVRLLSFCR